jgi:hypothetical protein
VLCNTFSRLASLIIFFPVFIEKENDMENSNELKVDRLDRIITVRMTDEDYNALLSISENKRSNVSRIIRLMLSTVIDMVKENNPKAK